MERSSMIDKLITAIALTIALGLFASLEHMSSFKTLAHPILIADYDFSLNLAIPAAVEVFEDGQSDML